VPVLEPVPFALELNAPHSSSSFLVAPKLPAPVVEVRAPNVAEVDAAGELHMLFDGVAAEVDAPQVGSLVVTVEVAGAGVAQALLPNEKAETAGLVGEGENELVALIGDWVTGAEGVGEKSKRSSRPELAEAVGVGFLLVAMLELEDPKKPAVDAGDIWGPAEDFIIPAVRLANGDGFGGGGAVGWVDMEVVVGCDPNPNPLKASLNSPRPAEGVCNC